MGVKAYEDRRRAEEGSDDGCQEDIPRDCRHRRGRIGLTKRSHWLLRASVRVGLMDLITMTYKGGGGHERFLCQCWKEGAPHLTSSMRSTSARGRSLVDELRSVNYIRCSRPARRFEGIGRSSTRIPWTCRIASGPQAHHEGAAGCRRDSSQASSGRWTRHVSVACSTC